jgi:predicted nuclease with TOPRIM domain
MMDEERTRVEVLLENLQTSVKVIAEGHIALAERFERMDNKFDGLEAKFDRLDMRVNGLETKFDRLDLRVNGLETRLDAFADDTQRRLKRIEGHLELNGSSRSRPQRKVLRTSPLKRRKKA